MDKHKLSEILQALPDSFSFTAVLEEAIKEKEGVSEQSQEQIQAQTLQDQNRGSLPRIQRARAVGGYARYRAVVEMGSKHW